MSRNKSQNQDNAGKEAEQEALEAAAKEQSEGGTEIVLTERAAQFFADMADRTAYRIVNSLFWITLLVYKEQGEIPTIEEVFSDETRGVAAQPDAFIFNRETQSSPNQTPLPQDSAYGSVYQKKPMSGRQYDMISNNSDSVLNGGEALNVLKEIGFEPTKSREDLYNEVLIAYRDAQAKRKAQADADNINRTNAAQRAASEVNLGI